MQKFKRVNRYQSECMLSNAGEEC